MTDRWLAAGFFVPRTDTALEALAACAGVCDVRDASGSGATHSGMWAGLHVQIGRNRLQLHDLLWIQLRQRELLDARPLDLPADLPLADDPNLRQAEAFRDACLALGAEVGVFVTHVAQAEIDRMVGDIYHHVLGVDAEALARSFVGLLYLDERMREGFTPPPGRDTLPSPRGLVLFVGHGEARWY
jgi:hypothetical protein